jgi:diguanylate cyclase (GGDEF)-like protein
VDGTLGSDLPSVLVRAGFLVALAYAAATAAHFRWTHHDAQIELREQLSSLADHDGLTGLLNHRAFHEHLARELAKAGRSGSAVSVLLADLDYFKAINDTHGHLAGDGVLRAVGDAVRASARTGDVGARLGGEEFAILLPGAGPATARLVAERLRAAVERMAGVSVTTSVGVSSSQSGEISPNELLERADGALYEAKRQGRNRVCWLRAA